jgi:hypothetical protein
MTVYRNLAISLLTGALMTLLSPFYASRARASAPAYDPNSIQPAPAAKVAEPPDDPEGFSLGSFLMGGARKITDAPKTFEWESSVNSDYLTDFGDTVGEGPVIQNSLNAGLGDRWSAGFWTDYAPKDPSGGNETDLYLMYDGFRLCEMNGRDVTGRAGAELYLYPAEQGENDLVFTIGANYEGADFDIDLYLKYLTSFGEGHDGFLTHLKVSRDYELWRQEMLDPREEGGMRLTLTPGVSMAIGNRYFSDREGLYHITPGAELRLIDGNTTFFLNGGMRLGFEGHENEGFIGAGMRHIFGGN